MPTTTITIAPRITLPSPKGRRRIGQRSELRVSVDIFDGGAFYDGVATNLSSGGMFVAGSFPLQVGAAVHARFKLPGSSAAMLVATEVRWVATAADLRGAAVREGLGLRFVRIKEEDLVRILEIMRA
jgi:uncharacterized protein (TIGR02266 family)